MKAFMASIGSFYFYLYLFMESLSKIFQGKGMFEPARALYQNILPIKNDDRR
jgi:hypothetical protein